MKKIQYLSIFFRVIVPFIGFYSWIIAEFFTIRNMLSSAKGGEGPGGLFIILFLPGAVFVIALYFLLPTLCLYFLGKAIAAYGKSTYGESWQDGGERLRKILSRLVLYPVALVVIGVLLKAISLLR